MNDTPCQIAALSPRERQCLSLLARGLRYEAIAKTLGTDARTVEKQVASARKKLKAATREQAVAIAIRHGLLLVEIG